jgi:putative Mg2+ transporter-C (MgtC) family protein
MGVAAAAGVPSGQSWTQVCELLLAFMLSSAIGLERQFRGKSAGLRTHAIVGTAAALIFLVSKYGFADMAASRSVMLDPSRIAAQIVSGIGFLGAGLIISRRGAIRGLTTAASIWETAGVGMAAAAGLPLLAVIVTALHLLIVFGYTPLGRRIGERESERAYAVTYVDGRGVLRQLLSACTARAWSITSITLSAAPAPVAARGATDGSPALVTVVLALVGADTGSAAGTLAGVDGVVTVNGAEVADGLG